MLYLFVRILERCNANCEMCKYAGNHDGYVFPYTEWPSLVTSASSQGVGCIRLTGGEPLIHPEIVDIVADAKLCGVSVSLITNGHLLERMIGELSEAGLAQVIVSIDSALHSEHDTLRGIKGLHTRAVAGLSAAKSAGLHTRVNTVCGPANFRNMPALQEVLTQLNVDQWELSTLKLERRLEYTEADREDLEKVTKAVYVDGPSKGMLRPMGKVWWGETVSEKDAYLLRGIAPRPTECCHVVSRVRYLDPATRLLYPCSLLPHRPDSVPLSVPVGDWSQLPIESPEMLAIVDSLESGGFRRCTGCSTTAAGFLPAVSRPNADWRWEY